MRMILIILAIFIFIFAVACTRQNKDTTRSSTAAVEPEAPQAVYSPQTVSRAGEGKRSAGSADIFTGNVFVEPVYGPMAPSRATGAYVTFEAGARSNWHNHPAGQTLVVTNGIAWTQEWDGSTYEAHAGEIIHCPPDVKHWHGASPYGPMTHVSVVESIDGANVQWMERVTDAQYEGARLALEQTAVDDMANVPWIDAREEGIITISAFTASGDIGRLRVALNEGLDAGLTVNEIKEIIIQLYAYAGFPRCLNALTAFMEVLEERGGEDEQGEAGIPLGPDTDKLSYGTRVQTELIGAPARGAIYDFAPAADQFLKEHLFGAIFGRGVLSYQEREIVTISALANIPGAESQLRSHFSIGMNTGLSGEKIDDIITVIGAKVGKQQGNKAAEVFMGL